MYFVYIVICTSIHYVSLEGFLFSSKQYTRTEYVHSFSGCAANSFCVCVCFCLFYPTADG